MVGISLLTVLTAVAELLAEVLCNDAAACLVTRLVGVVAGGVVVHVVVARVFLELLAINTYYYSAIITKM